MSAAVFQGKSITTDGGHRRAVWCVYVTFFLTTLARFYTLSSRRKKTSTFFFLLVFYVVRFFRGARERETEKRTLGTVRAGSSGGGNRWVSPVETIKDI